MGILESSAGGDSTLEKSAPEIIRHTEKQRVKE